MTAKEISIRFDIPPKQISYYKSIYDLKDLSQLCIELEDRLNVKLLAQDIMAKNNIRDIYEFFPFKQMAYTFMIALYSQRMTICDSVYRKCLMIINKFETKEK